MNKEIAHSEEFIRNIVGENAGFSIPENYFNRIEDHVMLSITKDKIPEKAAFNVPKDYFATLEDQILAKVTSEEKSTETKVISLKDRMLRFIPVAAAASVLLFVGLNYFSNPTITLDDISSEDLSVWFENSSEEINTEELAMYFESDDFEENLFSETTIDNNNLEEYLNSIDSESLLNEIN